MVAGSIEERIKKMKEAILTEAKERASTIVKNADEEANNERAMLFNHEKEKIHQEFVHLNKNERVKEKIEKSALNNRHRIQRMQARHEFVQKLRDEVSARLREIVKDQARYSQLIQNLILQGMLRMMERNLNVELKQESHQVAQNIFSNCQKEFTAILQKETGKEMESRLSLSEYTLEDINKNIIGGVFLRSSDGVIVCDNSLDSRVNLLFEHLLPTIRQVLFPPRAKKEQSLI